VGINWLKIETIMYWDVKKLSEYLSIKPSTLYGWVSRNHIPFVRIHGLIRFNQQEIGQWIESLKLHPIASQTIPQSSQHDSSLDALIAGAKRTVYNSQPRGNQAKNRALKEKEETNGAL